MYQANEATPPVRRRRLASILCIACALLVSVACSQGESMSLDEVRAQQAAGNHGATLDPLRAYLQDNPDDAEANFLYGRGLAMTEPHLAFWSLRKAMKDPDWFVPAAVQLALVGLAGDNYTEAIDVTTQALERDPDNSRALLLRANAYAHSRQDPERAIADARRALELEPEDPAAYEPLILGLLGLGDMEQAGVALQDAGRLLRETAAAPDLLAWHCATSAIYQQEIGDLDAARAEWEECLEAHPTDKDVVVNGVAFLDAQGERERATEVLRSVLVLEPEDRYFRTVLARRIAETGELAEAEALLREGTKSEDPYRAAAAWMDLGKFRQAIGEYGAAADAIGRVVELIGDRETTSPMIRFEYADSLVLAERLDRAEEVAQELSVPAHRHLILARVHQERGDPAAALAEYDETLTLWPDNPWARYYAAIAAEELGDFARALEEYRNSIRSEPGATDARARAALLLRAEGDLLGARTVLTTEMGRSPLDPASLLLAMRISGELRDRVGIADFLALTHQLQPAWTGAALAEAADGLARSGGSRLAVEMLATAPVDLSARQNLIALRALIEHAHALDTARREVSLAAAREVVAGLPESSAAAEIRAFDRELSGAPRDELEAAYARALELDPSNALARMGLGRVAAAAGAGAFGEAVDYFDAASALAPDDPEPRIAAAEALIEAGRVEEAAARLDRLLRDHPYEPDAALALARLDVSRGMVSERTLDRARRAAAFGRQADAFDLLSEVQTQLGDPVAAAKAKKHADALRGSAAAPRGTGVARDGEDKSAG